MRKGWLAKWKKGNINFNIKKGTENNMKGTYGVTTQT